MDSEILACFHARQSDEASINKVIGTFKDGQLHGLAKMELDNGHILVGRWVYLKFGLFFEIFNFA